MINYYFCNSDVENDSSDFSLEMNLMLRMMIFAINISVLIESDTAVGFTIFNENIVLHLFKFHHCFSITFQEAQLRPLEGA